jgi:TM2 domain-containing membrane protein YozV
MNKKAFLLLQKNIRDSIPEEKRSDFDLRYAMDEKSTVIAFLFSFFLGSLGIDRFYLGQIGWGLLKLFTLGGLGIWTFIDWFLIIGMTRSKNIEIATNCKSLVT